MNKLKLEIRDENLARGSVFQNCWINQTHKWSEIEVKDEQD